MCTIHGRALCVFSVPNETVVILWSASALERYTGESWNGKARSDSRERRYRPPSDASVSRSGSALLFFPRHSGLNLEQRSNVM